MKHRIKAISNKQSININMNNPDFNSIEFDENKNMSGSNSFSLTPKRWIETTNAKGVVSKARR